MDGKSITSVIASKGGAREGAKYTNQRAAGETNKVDCFPGIIYVKAAIVSITALSPFVYFGGKCLKLW